MDLSVIVVSFNTSQLLKSCLESLFQVLGEDNLGLLSEVFVVDNGSTDNSVEMVVKEFPKAIVLENKLNIGFSKANNQAIRQAKGEYILLLNSDTKVTAGSIGRLLKYAKAHPNVAVVGPRLLNKDDSIQFSAGYLPNLPKVLLWMLFLDDIPFIQELVRPYHINSKNFYTKSNNVDWVSGACFLIKKSVINKVGLLDEKIFMYGEEVEWCYRLKNKGYNIYYLNNSKVYHHKGASSLGMNAGIVEEFKTLKYIYSKLKPPWQLIILTFLLKVGALLRILLFGIIKRSKSSKSLYAKAYKVA